MSSLTSRYARAFADVVFARRLNATAALGELQTMLAMVASSEDLRQAWETPAIPAAQKRLVLDGLVQSAGLSIEVRNFLAVLIDHRRITLLAQVVRQVEQEINDRLGFTEAEIASFRPLKDDEKRALERQVEQLTGRKVRARYRQDANLLGGAVVRVGSTVYDGSIAGQLRKVREQLATS
jgi:F-type H+-transporting ATPase subunit delta